MENGTAKRMGRPAATTLAPNALAAYMRAFRAWKSGRGSKPAGRAQFCREFDGDMADMIEAAYGRDQYLTAEMAWIELRDAVLAEGAIGPTADYDGDSMPRPVFRLNGQPADEILLRLEPYGFYFDGDAELITELNERFDAYKRAGYFETKRRAA